MSAPTVSIIIVTWNVRELVLQCLESIYSDQGAPPFEIILVDNASHDGTAEAVLERFPDVRVLANRDNVGFPRANNQALQVARGRHVLFLNPDTEVGVGTLAACVAELEAGPDIGMVGCRLEYGDGRVQYEGARNAYRFRHLVYELLYLHMLFPRSRIFGHHCIGDWDHRSSRDVEALNGAYMMVPRELALAVGGLPEDLFMYHEDLSFCLRIRRAGHRVRYLGHVRAVHHCGQSSRRSSARLGLLEVECKRRFIEEIDGPGWGVAARVMLGLRAVLRLGASALGMLLPRSFKDRYPRAFDAELYWLQLRWSLRPGWVRGLMPRMPDAPAEPVRLGAWT